MKNYFFLFLALTALISCKDDDANVFDKRAEERTAEAIAALKNELVSPEHGWTLKYQPEPDAGSYYVILKFEEDNQVNIQTDLSVNGGEYYNQTISYNVRNSLGLELIFENYSFFSFLFEQEQAGFGAEFQFSFVNKTPDNALVFNSISDRGSPTRIVLAPATQNDVNFLGRDLSSNLSAFNTSLKLSLDDQDLAVYMTRDNLRRNIIFKYISKKTDIGAGEQVSFTTGYLVQGDSIILDEPFQTTFMNQDLRINSLRFDEYSQTVSNICSEPIEAPLYHGLIPNNGEGFLMENSLFDIEGANFHQRSDFFISPNYYIFDQDWMPADERIAQDVAGAQAMQLYYNLDLGGTSLYAIGFYIQNADESVTWALKEFTPVLNENLLQFNFADEYTFFGDQNTTADLNMIDKYLDLLTQGDKTYITRVNSFLYEFYNPCTGWRFFFEAI